MALTYRSVKGSALTITEMDNNLRHFTGSHSITGSLIVSGSGTFTNIGPSEFSGSCEMSGSLNVSGPIVISGSGNVITDQQTGSFATTGSNSFSGNLDVTGSMVITGSLTVSGSGTFNNIGPFNQTGVAIINGNTTITGSLTISGSNTFNNIGPFNQTGDSVFTGHITSSGNISASLEVSARGFNTRITTGTTQDTPSYQINGRKVEMLNMLQDTLQTGSFAKFTLTNTSIAANSIVLGAFTGGTSGPITGSIITCATTAANSASIQFHNSTGQTITNNTQFTASFIVL